jgi:single-stranded-DNA-specific exonuclease
LRRAPKVWQLLPHDREAIERLAAELRLSPLVAQLLLNRGLRDGGTARHFLEAPLTDLHAPQLLPDIVRAAERLYEAVKDGKRICIYGDYDVDGITGTAMLQQALRLIGGQAVDFYVPHRLEEGYGLNVEALRQIAQSGATLVVTVDCGIASLAEAEEARRLGLDLIITDHHEFKDTLPSATVLVHPRLPGGNYPFGSLCGAGVAFKLAWALCQLASGGGDKVQDRFRAFLLDSVALAALGTVADCVPLYDENRVFVRYGLKQLLKVPSLGLKALLQTAGLADKKELRADDVSYALAPRLNAASRLGCARLLLELLTTCSQERATTLARFLEDQNQKRQQIERRMLIDARGQLDGHDLDTTPALVLADPDWHPGVIGIVAGRLADHYARPTLLIALRSDRGEAGVIGQGSGRSVPGFPLHEALKACGDHLLSHGGHKAAAGFKIDPARIDAFREGFCAHAARHFGGQLPSPQLVLDAEVSLGMLTVKQVQELDRLEPYGIDNRRPLFLAGGVQVIGPPRKVGGGERHLRFQVRQQNAALWAIAFSMSERVEELMSAGGACCLAFTPRINEWQGRRSVELEVNDFQAGTQAKLQ